MGHWQEIKVIKAIRGFCDKMALPDCALSHKGQNITRGKNIYNQAQSKMNFSVHSGSKMQSRDRAEATGCPALG